MAESCSITPLAVAARSSEQCGEHSEPGALGMPRVELAYPVLVQGLEKRAILIRHSLESGFPGRNLVPWLPSTVL